MALRLGRQIALFGQSDFDLADLGLTVGSYSCPSSCYIQARAIHLTEGSTVLDKIKDRARLLAVNTRTDRSASVNYMMV